MYSPAEDYRRRGLVAKERAAQIPDLSLKEAFKDVARHWLALAERVDWLDRQHNGQQIRSQKPVEGDDIQKHKAGRVPTTRSQMPRIRPHGFSGKRAGRVPGQGERL
jgi:hypothetical protein